MTTKKASTALSVHTDYWQPRFLAALREGGHIENACKFANVSKTTVYKYYRDDPEFKKAWDTALYDAAWALEDEAVRRAKYGTDEPIIYRGRVIGTVKHYSDTLLMFLLKGVKPEKYADKLMIRIDADQAALLAKHGLTAGELWEQLIAELAASDVEADATGD